MKLKLTLVFLCLVILFIGDAEARRGRQLKKPPKLKKKVCVYNGIKYRRGTTVEVFEPACKELKCVANDDNKAELQMSTISGCTCDLSNAKNKPKRKPGKKPKCEWNTVKHENKEVAYSDPDHCISIVCKAKGRKGGNAKKAFYKVVYDRDCECKDKDDGKWSYTGENGVDAWADKFPLCGGESQSPIDISSSASSSGYPDFEFVDYLIAGKGTLLNNGHTAQYARDDNTVVPKISGGGLPGEYQFLQYHFHWGKDSSVGSEHLIDGQAFPMEVHFVHWKSEYGDVGSALGESDGLAVLGFMFEIQAEDNPAYADIVAALSSITNPADTTEIAAVALNSFLPASLAQGFYRYQGSLTTPTCNEAVVWTVFKDTLKISESQLEQFRQLIDSDGVLMVDNYRPVQPLNGRPVTQQ